MMQQETQVTLKAVIEIIKCKFTDLDTYREQVQESTNKIFLLYVAPRFFGSYYYYVIGKHYDGQIIESEVDKLPDSQAKNGIKDIIDNANFADIIAPEFSYKDDFYLFLNELFGHTEYQGARVAGGRHAMQIDLGKEDIDQYLENFKNGIINGISNDEFTAGFNHLAEKMPNFSQKNLNLSGVQEGRIGVGILLHAQLLSDKDQSDRLKLILSKSSEGAHNAPVKFECAGAMYPIRLALDKGKWGEAAALVEAGASCDAPFLVSDERQSHQPLLRYYANKENLSANDENAIKFLIEHGADVNPTAAISEIQAVAFADHQQKGVFSWPFLTRPANQLNKSERGFLQNAGEYYCVPVVGILFAKGEFDLVSQILEKKPDLIYMTYPAAHNWHDKTMLEVAAMDEHTEIVKMLLEFCLDDRGKFLVCKCLDMVAGLKRLNKPDVLVQLLLKANSLEAQIKAQGNSATYNDFVAAVLNLKKTFAAAARFINNNIADWKQMNRNLQDISIYNAIYHVIHNLDVQDSNEEMNLELIYKQAIAKMEENLAIVERNVSLALSKVPYNLVNGILESYFPPSIEDLGTRFVFEAVNKALLKHLQKQMTRELSALEPAAEEAPADQPPPLPPRTPIPPVPSEASNLPLPPPLVVPGDTSTTLTEFPQQPPSPPKYPAPPPPGGPSSSTTTTSSPNPPPVPEFPPEIVDTTADDSANTGQPLKPHKPETPAGAPTQQRNFAELISRAMEERRMKLTDQKSGDNLQVVDSSKWEDDDSSSPRSSV
jgi:hypothetical protein